MLKEQYLCDMKGCENEVKGWKGKAIQVIFTTEQTEGRGVAPYLDLNKVDLCEECLAKIISGEPVYGYGAQGNNEYYFKNK